MKKLTTNANAYSVKGANTLTSLLGLSLSVIAGSGCAQTSVAEPLVPETVLETLHAVAIGSDHFTVSVKSNGCTNADSFSVEVNGASNGQAQSLSIVRNAPDRCRRRTQVVDIELPLPEEAAGGSVLVANPFAAP